MDMGRGEERVRCMERVNMETYITICKILSQREFAVCFRKLKQGLCVNLEGWEGEGDGREVQKGGTIYIPIYIYLWLIHVEVWQKTTKFCKAIILQYKDLKKILNSTEQIQFTFFHLIKPVSKERKPEGRQERKTAVRKWKRMKKSNLKNLRYFKSPKHSYEILRLAFSTSHNCLPKTMNKKNIKSQTGKFEQKFLTSYLFAPNKILLKQERRPISW